ncbi:MAG: diguanylate cyclase [Clostridiales bacterium]|nr:diguanylate cyclase [Clostridiales bacterium]
MKHILIVDDEKINLAFARTVLAERYKVTTVTSGEQALKFLERNTADLILLDINMPQMDGFEVVNRIKLTPKRNIPIIFLTADNDAETETRCLEIGAVDFISKPFAPCVMYSRINRIFEIEGLKKSLADKLEQKTKEVADIKNRSYQDALTELWNRAYIEGQANIILAKEKGAALMMMDMDNFKAINDKYGHIEGDRTLKMFAQTLREFSCEGDILCRIGGDEFVVFIKNGTDKQKIASRASDIIDDMNKKLKECKFETNSSVSIGIAQSPNDGMDFETLYNAADKALYHTKQNGKNGYHFFSDQKSQDAKRADNLVDLKYLCEMMSRSDSKNGTYMVDFDSFHHVYNFVRRFVERDENTAQTVLFTLSMKRGFPEDICEIEDAVDILEQAVFTSLRRADISTRYSSKQLIVILMGAHAQNSKSIVERILCCFDQLYIGKKVSVRYDVADPAIAE